MIPAGGSRLRVLVIGWPWNDTAVRVPAPFRASWSQALDELQSELDARGTTANVYRSLWDHHPGVWIDMDEGQIRLHCDRYETSQQCLGMTANLRAITRTLTAYRQIERDGVVLSQQPALVAPGS